MPKGMKPGTLQSDPFRKAANRRSNCLRFQIVTIRRGKYEVKIRAVSRSY